MAYTAYGVDDTGGLSGATLKSSTIDGHPVAFAARYLSGFSKDLGSSEARDLSTHGIAIVCVWETTATRAESGHAAGVADAKAALAEANSRGMPAGRPIYFAVDEDTTAGPNVRGYFQGVNSVLGVARTGCYGGYKVVKGLFDAGLIAWGWQTYAWSGGQWDNRAHLEQYSNSNTLHGVGIDYDRALKTDYGQWRIGWTPSPQPTPQGDPDMAEIVSLGSDKTSQTLAPGKDAQLVITTTYDDPHKLRAGNAIKPNGYYKAHVTTCVHLTGLTPGAAGAVTVSWARMSTDGKKKLSEPMWMDYAANAKGEVRALLPWQMEVTNGDPVAVWVYNNDTKNTATVVSAVMMADLFTIA